MGMTRDGLSYWQAESNGEPLLETTVGDLLDRRRVWRCAGYLLDLPGVSRAGQRRRARPDGARAQ